MSAEVEVKVNIPPRRRSATLGVTLDDKHEAKAIVNVKSVRLTVTSNPGRYSSSAAVTLPRDLHALNALGQLIDAIKAEVIEQARWAEVDEAERAATSTRAPGPEDLTE